MLHLSKTLEKLKVLVQQLKLRLENTFNYESFHHEFLMGCKEGKHYPLIHYPKN